MPAVGAPLPKNPAKAGGGVAETAADSAAAAAAAAAAVASKQRRMRFVAGLDAARKRKETKLLFRDCQCGDGGVKGFNEGAIEIAEALEVGLGAGDSIGWYISAAGRRQQIRGARAGHAGVAS
jgi:hypothetical protein